MSRALFARILDRYASASSHSLITPNPFIKSRSPPALIPTTRHPRLVPGPPAARRITRLRSGGAGVPKSSMAAARPTQSNPNHIAYGLTPVCTLPTPVLVFPFRISSHLVSVSPLYLPAFTSSSPLRRSSSPRIYLQCSMI
jgi:hypothetical protein